MNDLGMISVAVVEDRTESLKDVLIREMTALAHDTTALALSCMLGLTRLIQEDNEGDKDFEGDDPYTC